MSAINIVSDDTTLSRIITLEAARLGLEAVCSSAPLSDQPLYLLDLDTCQNSSVPEGATVILLAEGGKDSLPAEWSARDAVVLEKPLLLEELRWVLTRPYPAFVIRPVIEKPATKKPRTRRESGLRLTIDHEARTATLTGGEPVKLSDTEYKILCLLYEHRNQPVSAEMAAEILGPADSNKYNVYICYLRKKLEQGSVRLIRTVRGGGYLLQIK